MRRRALLAAGALLPVAAVAQGFPERPVALICPFPPGGPLDALLRTLAEPMARRLGQPVVVENRPGAGGGLALSARLKTARPDGHVVSLIGMTAFRQPLLERVDYDPRRDFAWVCMLPRRGTSWWRGPIRDGATGRRCSPSRAPTPPPSATAPRA